jgi:hypothetical protein
MIDAKCLECNNQLYQYKNARGYCQSCYGDLIRNQIIKPLPAPPKTLTYEEDQILIGSLLGDGALIKGLPTAKNYHYYVGRQQSDYNYIEWNYIQFNNFIRNSKIIKFTKIDKREGWPPYYGCQFRTLAASIFSDKHSLWYPNNIKIIPNGVELSSISLAVWLCDDASIMYNNGKDTLYVNFSTHGFDKKSVENICDKLCRFTKEDFSVKLDRNKYYYISGYNNASLKLITLLKDQIKSMHMERKINKYLHML